MNHSTRNTWIVTIAIGLILLGAGIGLAYWKVTSGRVYTDNADIEAPSITLSPDTAGVLEEVYVHEGDQIMENTPVARVGDEILKAKVSGTVVTVVNDIGTQFNAGQAVVTMIDPTQLRVVAHVEEDKGLNAIMVGDRAEFTADAFGGKTFEGVVDEVSPTAHANDVVFNISDEREEQEFDVKIRFDTTTYPGLKNGMSAKVWIYNTQ